MAERRWFGQVLWWGRENGIWYVTHAGRRFPLARITAHEAETYGNGTRAGWHFAEHPDQPGHGELGPWLGRFIRHAQAVAEAWVLAPASDREVGPFAPSLISALDGSGRSVMAAAVFAAADGQALYMWPMPWEARIEIRDQRGNAVGWVGPWFQFGDDGEATLSWIGKVYQTPLTAQSSFHLVCTEFGRVLAAGATGGAGRG